MKDSPTELLLLTFLHPRRTTHFLADVSPDITGEEILEALVCEGFLDAALPTGDRFTLRHARTGRSIPGHVSIATCVVLSGDEIEVDIHVPG